MAAAGPILIAGGGIGGLALALALAKWGRSATVLEQREQFATEGAGIQLGPNGVRMLERLGLAEPLRATVGEPDTLQIHHGRTGSLLATLPLGRWIAARHGAPYWAAHRGDLHGVLLAAASAEPHITLRTGFALASFTEQGASVTASSGTGATVEGCALIGADGLWSRVREAVCPNHRPEFVGATATRTVLEAAKAGGLAAPAVGLWLTPGVHVVHYPVRRGSEVAVVVIAAEDWQGREWDAAADRGTLLAHLAAFHRSLTDVLAPVSEWRKWALYRLAPLPRWSAGRVALMGDAAHPTLPYLAQGGVLALEDALVLATCLSGQVGDEAGAFRLFETLRRKRATRMQALSRRQGRIYHLPTALSWVRDAGLRLVPGAWLMAGYDWLYGWQADVISAPR
jgi:2-polyprenyl-6-methoxyphenol hydroxylase-like FAD-dependent oxidoreductase